ncbi:hypothetical protein MTO96_008103 [Rhipicephalus appendiculatus]
MTYVVKLRVASNTIRGAHSRRPEKAERDCFRRRLGVSAPSDGGCRPGALRRLDDFSFVTLGLTPDLG